MRATIRQNLGTFSVSWGQEIGEWLYWLERCLSDGEGWELAGYEGNMSALAIFFRDAATQIPVKMLVTADVAGIAVDLVGEHQQMVDAIRDRLATAARAAATRVGTENSDFEWAAVIGYSPTRVGGGRHRARHPIDVGGMRVESSEIVFSESAPSVGHVSMHRWTNNSSVPLLVQGESSGYDEGSAREQAAVCVHRLAAMLSVAWSDCLVVRSSPELLDRGGGSVPSRLGWQSSGPSDLLCTELGDFEHADWPSWIDSAWDLLEDGSILDRSLAAFHEGLLVMQEHPSLAMVSFVASIETLGEVFYKREKCEECQSSPGFRALFQAALELVIEPWEAKSLKSTYNRRSRTVHSGRFYGGERTSGNPTPFGHLKDDAPVHFSFGQLGRLRDASRRLLVSVFVDGFPERRILGCAGNDHSPA